METITIPLEQYKCLRGHLEKANEIFKSLGVVGSNASERKASELPPKETKPQKINKYKELIASGKRVTKPNHLRK
jgi:hypothetical protein